jgi:hypothetical protein
MWLYRGHTKCLKKLLLCGKMCATLSVALIRPHLFSECRREQFNTIIKDYNRMADEKRINNLKKRDRTAVRIIKRMYDENKQIKLFITQQQSSALFLVLVPVIHNKRLSRGTVQRQTNIHTYTHTYADRQTDKQTNHKIN